jgi:hypothetical protein
MAIGPAARAELSNECSLNALCYCVQNDLKNTVATRVDEIRARIAGQRQQGKAIGYLSIPISTVAGVTSASTSKSRRERKSASKSASACAHCGC